VLLQRLSQIQQPLDNISTFLTVPFDHQFLKSNKYNQMSLAHTAFPTPEGAILLSKKDRSSHTIPMPSHPDAAAAPSPYAHYLPVSWGCCDVLQSAEKQGSMCTY
jgi:hypothetical protein